MAASLPIVYACAGCCDAGDVAYRLARELNRQGIAEMSCLSGLASGRKTFAKLVEGREIWLIDGCPLHCAKAILRQAKRRIALHVCLDDLGVPRQLPPEASVDLEALARQVVALAGIRAPAVEK